MNQRFYFLCTATLLALGMPSLLTLGVPFLADSNTTATVHGATYAWDTFEPLNDTLININSNPPQSIVAKDGTYSFELAPGDYTITARYYQNNTLLYSREATLKIEAEGNYVFDLLLYPAYENPGAEAIAGEVNTLNSMDSIEQPGNHYSLLNYLPAALVLFLLLGGSYKFFSRDRKMEKSRFKKGRISSSGLMVKFFGKGAGFGIVQDFGSTEKALSAVDPLVESTPDFETEITAMKKLPLSSDLRDVLDIIKSHKGRITQKDLRSRLDHSEVKVSLMLSELEKRGLIKKFKNGRENILILTDQEY